MRADLEGGTLRRFQPDGSSETPGPGANRPLGAALGLSAFHSHAAPAGERWTNGHANGVSGMHAAAERDLSEADMPHTVANGTENYSRVLALRGQECAGRRAEAADMLANWPMTDSGPMALPSAQSSGLPLTPSSSGQLSGGMANGSTSGTEEPSRWVVSSGFKPYPK